MAFIQLSKLYLHWFSSTIHRDTSTVVWKAIKHILETTYMPKLNLNIYTEDMKGLEYKSNYFTWQ